MNQHDFVKGCLGFYQNEGLTPEKGWEEAHYPAPKEKGEATVWMTHDHHQIQGLLQSKEYDQQCFFNGDAKRFLTYGPFVPGWFELWDIYDAYSGQNGRKSGKENVELSRGICRLTPEEKSEAGRRGGKSGGKKGSESQPREVKVKCGQTSNSLRYQNTDPRFPPYVSTPMGLSNWQKSRSIDTSMRVKVG